MHIALITAGGAGMFCGSCMHDNTLARALMAAGAEVSLIPTYTPIRVDERNVSEHRVFMGGVNVYLDAQYPIWRHLPRWMTRWLDAPAILKVASLFAVTPNAQKLGKLAVALLKGDAGPERNQVDEFAAYLGHLKPDVVCFSNALLAGALPAVQREYAGPVYCLLQGDDIFLEDLPEPYRTQCLDLVRSHAQRFAGFLVHSRYYRDFMADYLQLPLEKFHVIPLGIDFTGHDGQPRETAGQPFTIGYFARICPEKGLHQLIDAFRLLHARHPQTQLKAGGYLGARDKRYFQQLSRAAADLGPAFEYIGSPPGHTEKVAFLKSLDVLSVPTTYREPKGIYILEALANGVPVVQPRHGSFPELIDQTGGGLLCKPGDPEDLAQALESLLLNSNRRLELARTGYVNSRSQYDPATMARETLRVFKS